MSSGRVGIGTDVGKLQPVQVVRLSENAGQVMVETDAGTWGVGNSVEEALDSLRSAADGEVVLDTAEFLILTTEDEALIKALADHLRPSCLLCRGDGETDLEQARAFLEIHSPKLTLMRYRAGERGIPRLVQKDGRSELVS